MKKVRESKAGEAINATVAAIMKACERDDVARRAAIEAIEALRAELVPQ